MNTEIMEALWSLKNDADWAYKQGLAGTNPDLHTLGSIWKRLEQAVMQEDAEMRAKLKELSSR